MYINVENLFKLPNPMTLTLLLVLRHASKRDVSEEIARLINDDDLEVLEERGYIKYVKGKKSLSPLHLMRLDKKGTAFLNALDEPDVEEQDIQIFDWLSAIYTQKDKQIGNGKKTKRLIASFREKSGIEKNHLAFLCNAFINDDAQQEYSFKLEFVFWKPKNLFQSKFVLEDSRLWDYYKKRKDYFDQQFKKIK
jgi:hypothetical protein